MYSEALRLRHFHKMNKCVLSHKCVLSNKRIFKDNSGSIFVESAMVVPLILVLVFSAIFLLMDFYTLVVDETHEDNAAFAEGFKESVHIRQAAAVEKLI